ncbi:hypothetical protein [Neochlamydia sp. S13]|uniref:hypothetical protein n=1 Tax=Neochlamydia sp. S13 TaxID=1353976 RepID=UPI0005A7DE65|nr:hypothetical protein [Neochlamydia sp. S13]BBI17969.1 hypothetical protein NCS13_1_1774 [Neochlamydia sp. S13]
MDKTLKVLLHDFQMRKVLSREDIAALTKEKRKFMVNWLGQGVYHAAKQLVDKFSNEEESVLAKETLGLPPELTQFSFGSILILVEVVKKLIQTKKNKYFSTNLINKIKGL